MEEGKEVHVMVVTFSAQGLINPLLELAKTLALKGLRVTFAATEIAGKRMQEATNVEASDGSVQFRFFSDGWDLDAARDSNVNAYMNQLSRVGPNFLAQLIQSFDEKISCIISNPFLPWVADVAKEMKIRCAMLWTQPFAVFAIYYRHFCGSDISPPINTGLPKLKVEDLPTFLLPSNPYVTLSNALSETFKNLMKVKWVLVNSFIELEREAIEAIQDVPPIKMVGPLVRLDNHPSTTPRGDMWRSADCLEWLDTQAASTVVYISFGTVVVPSQKQVEEIAWALRQSERPFLWVIKPTENATGRGSLPERFLEETAQQGKVVSWCPQVEVLSHPSIACFLTHCGWNSTLESLVTGVPVIAFPDRGDQVTNAKLLVEVYKTGVRLRCDTSGFVGREEMQRGITETMYGAQARKLKENALKWKKLAREAVSDGGSSAQTIQSFADEIMVITRDSHRP